MTDTTLIVFICLSVLLIAVPSIAILAVWFKKTYAACGSTRQANSRGLRTFKLSTLLDRNNTRNTGINSHYSSQNPISHPPHITARNNILPLPPTPAITRQDHHPHKTRTLRLPPKLASLPTRTPAPGTQPITPRPDRTLRKTTSTSSPVSSISSDYIREARTWSNSPISPEYNSTTTAPYPQPTATATPSPTTYTGHNAARQSSVIFDRDLLMELMPKHSPPSDGSDHSKRKGKGIEPAAASGAGGVVRRYPTDSESGSGDEHAIDLEWKEAWMETVDGVLAPREWV